MVEIKLSITFKVIQLLLIAMWKVFVFRTVCFRQVKHESYFYFMSRTSWKTVFLINLNLG